MENRVFRLFQGDGHWANILAHDPHNKASPADCQGLRMRITGGQARGRIIKVPQTDTVRPTTDKMRQQLFNMLTHSPWAVGAGFDLVDAHVFDGFCGSGSLGLEALSRYAASCVFVDFDARVLQVAKDNVKTCKFDDVSTFLMKSCAKLGVRPEKIPARNLALLDPPYRKDFITPSLIALVEGHWLADGALVVAESEKGWRAEEVPTNLTQSHTRVDGDSQLNVWNYKA